MPALIIDNYDSFTFNLVHAVAAITGEMPIVVRNDEMTWEELRGLDFDCAIISPGPGRPDRERDFGVSRDVILKADVPVLGVCLGHQGIAHLFGGKVERIAPMHGRSSEVIHDGDELFRAMPERFSAVRYHSLAVLEPLPDELRKIAWTSDGVVMALRHRDRPIWGVQFHPESICSEYGNELLRNFLARRVAARRVGLSRLPLQHPPEVLFRELFAKETHAFWLDSALVTARSRFSYMGASDDIYRGGFEGLDELLAETPVADDGFPFPFTGGYVGYFGYECGAPGSHASRQRDTQPASPPDSMLLRVERFLAIDHVEQALYLVGGAAWASEIEGRIATIETRAPAEPLRLPRPEIRYRIGKPEYLARIRECLQLIEDGESYELCLTNKVCLETDVPALTYYETLRRTNPAPYAAFLRMDGFAVASTSPECFLRIDRERRAESRPIKGTIRRGRDAEEDARLRDILAGDERFRAENLMIVDLVRHDLSRVCEVGSVRVPGLMEVETYETVHQLVSTITGQLTPEATTGDCLRALFPGGSMTGAPKLRSMELLAALEQAPRGIYSGSIGYLGFNGTVDLSIVIRTAVFEGRHVSLGVGGAIVAQSEPEAEWDEMELKAHALLRAFELA